MKATLTRAKGMAAPHASCLWGAATLRSVCKPIHHAALPQLTVRLDLGISKTDHAATRQQRRCGLRRWM